MDIRIGPHRLRPVNGECLEFHAEVKNLNRPYIKINEHQHQRLLDSGYDFFQISNGSMSGRVVTYGSADSGYALMPVCQQRAEALLSGA